MPNLTPSNPGKRPQQAEAPITRVVVVREGGDRGTKHVRHNEEPSRFGARTGFWSAIGFGTIAFLWLTGHLGETLGFGAALGMGGLTPSTDGGLAAGVRLILSVPLRIFEMTMVDPVRLVAACLLIAAPAAGLAVSAPRVPGGPAPSPLARGFSIMGLVAAGLVFAGLVTWIAWPGRQATLGLAPLDRAAFGPWLAEVQAVAGFDALALVTAVLWLTLLFRLPIPRVAVAFATTAGFLAAFAAWTGFAVSNGIVDGCTQERLVITPIGMAADDIGLTRPRSLVLGSLDGRVAILGSGPHPLAMSMSDQQFLHDGRSSLAEWMKPLPTE